MADGVQESAASEETGSGVVETLGGSPEFRGTVEVQDPMRPTLIPAPANVPVKFWDAEKGVVNQEALLASYKELESKIGQPKGEAAEAAEETEETSEETSEESAEEATEEAQEEAAEETEETSEETSEETEEEAPEAAPALNDAIEAAKEAYKATGELPAEVRAPLIEAGISNDQIDLYLAGVRATEAAMKQAALTAAGVDDYGEVEAAIEWASKNWTAKQINAFNSQTGDVETVPQAITALFQDYRKAEPGEGRLTSINAGTSRGDVYTNRDEFQRELDKADRERDPVARRNVIAKMDRSLKNGSIKNKK